MFLQPCQKKSENIMAMRDKAEDLLEKSEDVVVVGDITRFVKEFKMAVESSVRSC